MEGIKGTLYAAGFSQPQNLFAAGCVLEPSVGVLLLETFFVDPAGFDP